MINLKKELKTFMDDIEKNINNSEDLKYVKNRVTDLFEVILDEMDKVVNVKEKELEALMERQDQLEEKMNEMQQIVNNIEKDIYLEDEFDFEITCPYCNHEFLIDMDEDKTEVVCPECKNVIELDWTGNLENDEFGCSSTDCSSCPGCFSNDKPEDEDDDM